MRADRQGAVAGALAAAWPPTPPRPGPFSRRRGLLSGPDRKAETPLSEDEQKTVRGRLQRLVGDPLRRVLDDDEFTGFTRRQYKHVFRGEGERDATGRMIMTPPARADLETFRPSVKRRELKLSGSVGESARNRMRDVVGVKKGLSNTGLFEFDFDNERSTDANERFVETVKTFQKVQGLEPDGLLNPKGKTVTALDRLLFPEGGGGSRTVKPGEGPDLRPRVAATAAAESKPEIPVEAGDVTSPSDAPADGGARRTPNEPSGQARTESAEMKVQRVVPFDKEVEFNGWKSNFDRADGDFSKDKVRYRTADNPQQRLSAAHGVATNLLSSAVNARGMAKILDEPELVRSATALKKKAEKVQRELFQRNTANVDDLIRDGDKMRALTKKVLEGERT